MKFQDKVSQAIFELERLQHPEIPPLPVEETFEQVFERPANVSAALDIIRGLKMIEADDLVEVRNQNSAMVRERIIAKLGYALGQELLRRNLVHIDIADHMGSGGIRVRARLRAMTGAP